MITGIHISQEIFAIDVLTVLNSSLEQHWKHVLQLLLLYGDQALMMIDGVRKLVRKDSKVALFMANASISLTYFHISV